MLDKVQPMVCFECLGRFGFESAKVAADTILERKNLLGKLPNAFKNITVGLLIELLYALEVEKTAVAAQEYV